MFCANIRNVSWRHSRMITLKARMKRDTRKMIMGHLPLSASNIP